MDNKKKRSVSFNTSNKKRNKSKKDKLQEKRKKSKSTIKKNKKISFSYLEEDITISDYVENNIIPKKISKTKIKRSISNSKIKIKKSISDSKKNLTNSKSSNFSNKRNLSKISEQKKTKLKEKNTSNDLKKNEKKNPKNKKLQRILKNSEIFRKNTLNEKQTNLNTENFKLDYLLYKIAKFSINENEKLINNWFDLKIKNITKKQKKRLTLNLKEKYDENLIIEIMDFQIPDIKGDFSEFENEDFYNIHEENEKMDIQEIRKIRKSINIIENTELKKRLENGKLQKNLKNEDFKGTSENEDFRRGMKNDNLFNNSENDNLFKKEKFEKNQKNKDKRVSEVFSTLDLIKKNNFFVYDIRFFKLKNMIRKAKYFDQVQKIEIKQKKFMKKIQIKERKKSIFNFPILKNITKENFTTSYKEEKKIKQSEKNMFKEEKEKKFDENENKSKKEENNDNNNFQNEKNNFGKRKNSFGKKKKNFRNEENFDNSDDSIIMVKDMDYLNRRIVIKDYGRFNYTKMLGIGKNLGDRI